VAAHSASPPRNDEDVRRRQRSARELRLFETFPKGLRLRPGRRYQEAAFRAPVEDAGADNKDSPPGQARGGYAHACNVRSNEPDTASESDGVLDRRGDVQSLNFSLVRAAMIASERWAPTCGSLSSSALVAVLRLILAAIGAVAAPVVVGFAGAGAAAEGAGLAGCAGGVPCAKAGTASSAAIAEGARRRVNIGRFLS